MEVAVKPINARNAILAEVYEVEIEAGVIRHGKKHPSMILTGEQSQGRLYHEVQKLLRDAFERKGDSERTVTLKVKVRQLSRREFLFGK